MVAARELKGKEHLVILKPLLILRQVRRYKQNELTSKISVDSNFAFTSYA